MLNVNQLDGFGATSPDLKLTYVGQLAWSSGVGSVSLTLPVDTAAVLMTGHTSMNGWTTDLLNYVKVDGVDATQIVLAQRLDEYRCDTSIWVLNGVTAGARTVTANKSRTTQTGRVHVWALTKQFKSYAPSSQDTDTDASDPLDCNVDIYKGGIAVAGWFSKFGTASCTYLDPGWEVTNNGCTAGLLCVENVTSKQILMEDGAGGNDGQTAAVVSFSPDRFY